MTLPVARGDGRIRAGSTPWPRTASSETVRGVDTLSVLLVVLLPALCGANGAPQTATPPAAHASPSERHAFAGLALRDNPEGCVVSRVRPGPFGGDGTRSESLWRGDLVVAVNGRKVDAKSFADLVEKSQPGDELVVLYKRGKDAEAHLGDAIPAGDPSGEERTVSVVLEAREDWTGTIGRPLRAGAVVAEAVEGQYEKRILDEAAKAGIRTIPDGVDALLAYVRRTQDHVLDANSSPLVVQALRRPLSLDATEATLATAVQAFARNAATADGLGPAAQALVTWAIDGRPPAADVVPASLAADRAAWGERARALVARHRDSVSIDPSDARSALALISASPDLASRAIEQAGARLARLAEDESALAKARGVPDSLRERVAATVRGDVVAAFECADGLCVVGGPGPNVYAMSQLARVHDQGGDDRYSWSARFEGDEQIVVDLSGDDVYESTADFAGPGVAVFGLSIIDDRAGDDAYTTTRAFAQACGLFGVGLIVDRGGRDRYASTSADSGFAQGVGYFGAGILLDLAGDDGYVGEKLAQGVGGPRGFGLLVDVAGDDEYRANGPSFPSVYGTAGAFVGMSQGMGYGIRADAAGGVGALFDLAGDDRYDVGEFGQGCGYFYALGVLHDGSGDDVYASQRYGQGTGAHQAAGILVDEAGDDRYGCKQVAFQGGAWDQTVAWLLDRAGDDAYAGSGLGQGAAAQQAIGVLVDCAGKDRYDSPQAQGESGGNDYHFDECGIRSFSVLLDLGRAQDEYSTGRANGAVTKTGARNDATPAAANLHGLCIDD